MSLGYGAAFKDNVSVSSIIKRELALAGYIPPHENKRARYS